MVKTIFYDLVHTFFFLNRTYSGKITITFEPLVRFWNFKALNWSTFNFLLICGNFSLLLWITRKMPEKMSIINPEFERNFFFGNDHMLSHSPVCIIQPELLLGYIILNFWSKIKINAVLKYLKLYIFMLIFSSILLILIGYATKSDVR